jgi:hypothetical protein
MAVPFLPQNSFSKNSKSLFSEPETIRSESFLFELFAASVVVLPFRDTATSKVVFPLSVHPDKTRDNKRIEQQLKLENFVIIPPP